MSELDEYEKWMELLESMVDETPQQKGLFDGNQAEPGG